MRVALVQNQPVFGKKTANIRQLKALIAPVSADLFVLPELAYTGYQFRSFNELRALADGPDSVYIEEMHALARAKQAGIVFGFAEQDGSRIYNAALLITPAGESCLYRKTHLFYREKQLFTPGDTGFHVFPFQGVRLGMAICFDWVFPESFRTLALQGADLVVLPANLVMPYCQQVLYARAVENHIFIACANRVGEESRTGESLRFTGGSVALSPSGDYLARGPETGEQVLVVDMDLPQARDKHINPLNDLFAERRPELYWPTDGSG